MVVLVGCSIFGVEFRWLGPGKMLYLVDGTVRVQNFSTRTMLVMDDYRYVCTRTSSFTKPSAGWGTGTLLVLYSTVSLVLVHNTKF